MPLLAECLECLSDPLLLLAEVVLEGELELVLAVSVDLLQVHCHHEGAKVLRRLKVVDAWGGIGGVVSCCGEPPRGTKHWGAWVGVQRGGGEEWWLLRVS